MVQLTPPGSACPIVVGVGISDPHSAPVLNLHLVVDDLDLARRTLIGNGIDVSDVNDMGGGIRYAYFSDPDGNSWALQQISGKLFTGSGSLAVRGRRGGCCLGRQIAGDLAADERKGKHDREYGAAHRPDLEDDDRQRDVQSEQPARCPGPEPFAQQQDSQHGRADHGDEQPQDPGSRMWPRGSPGWRRRSRAG